MPPPHPCHSSGSGAGSEAEWAAVFSDCLMRAAISSSESVAFNFYRVAFRSFRAPSPDALAQEAS